VGPAALRAGAKDAALLDYGPNRTIICKPYGTVTSHSAAGGSNRISPHPTCRRQSARPEHEPRGAIEPHVFMLSEKRDDQLRAGPAGGRAAEFCRLREVPMPGPSGTLFFGGPMPRAANPTCAGSNGAVRSPPPRPGSHRVTGPLWFATSKALPRPTIFVLSADYSLKIALEEQEPMKNAIAIVLSPSRTAGTLEGRARIPRHRAQHLEGRVRRISPPPRTLTPACARGPIGIYVGLTALPSQG